MLASSLWEADVGGNVWEADLSAYFVSKGLNVELGLFLFGRCVAARSPLVIVVFHAGIQLGARMLGSIGGGGLARGRLSDAGGRSRLVYRVGVPS
jgi:hypothetical protein